MNVPSTPIPTWRRSGNAGAFRIADAGTDLRVTVFGALDVRSGPVQTMMADRGNGPRFLQFLKRLIQRWPTDQVLLVMDNVPYHKTAAVRSWLADHADRMTVCWLPTYSPNLNRIERVWRFVRAKLACKTLAGPLSGARTGKPLPQNTRAVAERPTPPKAR